MTTTMKCDVCGEVFPNQYAKFDSDAPVFTDNGAYHLGCEDAVLNTEDN